MQSARPAASTVGPPASEFSTHRTAALHRVLRWQDNITIAGNYMAMLLLFAICVALCYEVGARYLFNAPTKWASALVSYLLCAAIFLAAPDLTRRNAHVVINVLRDALPPAIRARYVAFLRLVCSGFCFFAAWFCGVETIDQYLGDIDTILEWPVPKWTVSIFIPYGFASAALYFLRHVFDPPAATSEEITS